MEKRRGGKTCFHEKSAFPRVSLRLHLSNIHLARPPALASCPFCCLLAFPFFPKGRPHGLDDAVPEHGENDFESEVFGPT